MFPLRIVFGHLHCIGNSLIGYIFIGNWSYGSQLSVFQDTLIQGETPLLWPVWLRAAVPGDINLYMTIYYEVGDTSSVMRYRTLRMHYNLQVCLFESDRWNVLA